MWSDVNAGGDWSLEIEGRVIPRRYRYQTAGWWFSPVRESLIFVDSIHPSVLTVGGLLEARIRTESRSLPNSTSRLRLVDRLDDVGMVRNGRQRESVDTSINDDRPAAEYSLAD